jgi:hypothetical protein
LTSSFPSTTRGHNRAQLDSIIFYSGPASAKTRETASTENDEWLETNMIFADSAQHALLDAAGGLDITSIGGLFNISVTAYRLMR